MSKSDITIEQAQVVIDRVAQELGLLQTQNSGFLKIEGPTNKHRLYVQKARNLGRIDLTIDLPQDDPAYVQLKGPCGSIKCHVLPTLEQLERCLRMLGDGSLGKQVPNKPRPFAASKQPPRRPKAVAAPIPESALTPIPEDGVLKDRLAKIAVAAKRARAMRIVENPDVYGKYSFDEALAIIEGGVDLAELRAQVEAEKRAELGEVLAETGIEVAQ